VACLHKSGVPWCGLGVTCLRAESMVDECYVADRRKVAGRLTWRKLWVVAAQEMERLAEVRLRQIVDPSAGKPDPLCRRSVVAEHRAYDGWQGYMP